MCVDAWVQEATIKNWQKKKKAMQQDLETVQDLVKAAQMVFNKYIRERDKDELCISCKQKPKKENAGHFYNANNHWNVRFDEDNVHLQCEACNTYLSGNLLNYQIGIEKRIGAEKLIELQGRAHLEKRWTVEEIKEIIKKYKELVRDMK